MEREGWGPWPWQCSGESWDERAPVEPFLQTPHRAGMKQGEAGFATSAAPHHIV